MILVISGTNRKNALTHRIAEYYVAELEKMTGQDVMLTKLEDLPADLLNPDIFEPDSGVDALKDYREKVFSPAEKIIILAPEYNGGFPGVLKLFLDGLSVRNFKSTFNGKKAALVGISSGRAGNLRGMEHLTGILHYLKVNVLPNKLPISQVKLLMQDDKLVDQATERAIHEQLEEFLAY